MYTFLVKLHAMTLNFFHELQHGCFLIEDFQDIFLRAALGAVLKD